MVACAHPLDPLRADEVKSASALIGKKYNTVKYRFQQIEVQEPSKKELAPFIEAERLGQDTAKRPDRIVRAYLWVYNRDITSQVELRKVWVNLTLSVIAKDELMPQGAQAPIHYEEMMELEGICLKHPRVIEEIKRLKVPAGYTVCNDPWMYGTESPNNVRRFFQCYMYVTKDVPMAENESNHYARPLDFSPIFDGHTWELVDIIRLPLGIDHVKSTGKDPWEQVSGCEYAHELTKDGLRKDSLKSLIVKQPDGPSFVVDGHEVSWQKWQFRVGFNMREGLVIHNVRYDGRPLFYRLAVSEMTVPYADPRSPYHRKQAFDFGDVGIGLMANKLGLGCDCLGSIRYFDGVISNGEGQPIEMKNVICMHEVDDGILWKHTNYRNEKARVVRNRKLVVQTIATVGNYEYIFAWEFDLAANIHQETRATGVLSTMPISRTLVNGTTAEGREMSSQLKFGTVVSEGVMAANHQHIFSVRIDPMVDGHKNVIVQEESVAMPDSTDENPWGIGYNSIKTPVSHVGHADLDVSKARTFHIQNPTKINPISGKPVAYKLHAHPSQMILMNPSSYSYKRAYFARHPIFVTKYHDDELYAAGEFTNQSTTDTGLGVWSTRDEDLNIEEGDDVVLWHNWSLTHNPRPEDFPVMPVEIVKIALKPTSAFTQNPSNDVRPSNQADNQSTLVNGTEGHYVPDAVNGTMAHALNGSRGSNGHAAEGCHC